MNTRLWCPDCRTFHDAGTLHADAFLAQSQAKHQAIPAFTDVVDTALTELDREQSRQRYTVRLSGHVVAGLTIGTVQSLASDGLSVEIIH